MDRDSHITSGTYALAQDGMQGTPSRLQYHMLRLGLSSLHGWMHSGEITYPCEFPRHLNELSANTVVEKEYILMDICLSQNEMLEKTESYGKLNSYFNSTNPTRFLAGFPRSRTRMACRLSFLAPLCLVD